MGKLPPYMTGFSCKSSGSEAACSGRWQLHQRISGLGLTRQDYLR
jgi:hypothetical protein